MEQTAQSRPACRGPWRALCLGALVAGVTALVWAIAHFGTRGDRTHSGSDGAELFALMIGPLCAFATTTRRSRACRKRG